MRILVLDDDLSRHEAFRRRYVGCHLNHAHDYESAVAALSELPPFDLVQLDHDLSWERAMGRNLDEKNGHDVALFISWMPVERRPLKVIVHSFNPVGAQKMCQTLSMAGVSVSYEPFRP